VNHQNHRHEELEDTRQGRPHTALARIWHAIGHVVRPHSHDASDKVDSALEASREGIKVLWVSLAVLGVTTIAEFAVVAATNSVALLGDALHNLAAATTAIPLGVAFLIGRRAATRRYTYGYGRAEDLAGIVIVAFIAASSVAAGYEAIDRLLHPAEVAHLWAVAAAGVIGFVGNEMVARYRIMAGRRIGSTALVADGLHARTDGFASLAVVLGAGGVALGWRWADPIVCLAITVAILLVLKDAGREIYHRLMDAVDPDIVDQAETTLRATAGVRDVGPVHLRWIEHNLHAGMHPERRPDPHGHRGPWNRRRRRTPSHPRHRPPRGCPDPHRPTGRARHRPPQGIGSSQPCVVSQSGPPRSAMPPGSFVHVGLPPARMR
jgi:cation diffusion facilitator family transporter